MNGTTWFHATWSVALVLCMCSNSYGKITLLDFEHEDDFSTPLVNGQIIDPDFDPVDLEFGNLVNISSKQLATTGNLGVTIFDSSPTGPNKDARDADLLVDTGNILILQATESSGIVNDPVVGATYAFPNDEAEGRYSFMFDFMHRVRPLSIDIVDADRGFQASVILTDSSNRIRTYSVPAQWTFDVTSSMNGYDTLRLDTLAPQIGEGGATATAVEALGFDPESVVSLEVQFIGDLTRTSGGLDNLQFTVIPEPSTLVLSVFGILTWLGITRRRSRLRTNRR